MNLSNLSNFEGRCNCGVPVEKITALTYFYEIVEHIIFILKIHSAVVVAATFLAAFFDFVPATVALGFQLAAAPAVERAFIHAGRGAGIGCRVAAHSATLLAGPFDMRIAASPCSYCITA